MPYLTFEDEGSAVYTAYTPDIAVSEKPGLIRLTVRQWQVGQR
jgi:hypothetical protein